MDDKVFDEITELLQEGVDQLADGPTFPELERGQPKAASWIVIDVTLRNYATDVTTAIHYKDAKTMQEALIVLIKSIWTPQLLEYVRNGEIKNLTLRVGPDALRGFNLNDENGIDLS